MSKENSLKYWLDYIQTTEPKEIDLGLQRIKHIYDQLIKPKIVSKVIVVGGTNGKGTTAEFLSQLLVSKNKTVGTFTSPHLFNFNERIKVNGKPVSDESIIESFKLIEDSRGSTNLTYFDFSTLASLLIFNKLKVDYMVLEIGLGAILTNVELDHQDWLGEDRESIGKEKAAIFKPLKPVIIGQHEVPNSIHEKILETKNQAFFVGKEFDYQVDDLNKKWTFTFKGENQVTYSDIKLGSFSVSSLSCALAAFCILEQEISLDMDAIFSSLDLKGRCELIDNRYLLDVSHNEASARYLSSFIERNFEDGTIINAVFGVMEDKDVDSILEALATKINKWYVASTDIERSMASEKLRDIIASKSSNEVELAGSVTEACLKAQEETKEGSLILIFGSFYTVAEAFPALKILRSVA